MRVNINKDKSVAVDQGYPFQPIRTAPVGVKCTLLTRYGVAIQGQYSRGMTDIIAWAPLPYIPPEIKELIK